MAASFGYGQIIYYFWGRGPKNTGEWKFSIAESMKQNFLLCFFFNCFESTLYKKRGWTSVIPSTLLLWQLQQCLDCCRIINSFTEQGAFFSFRCFSFLCCVNLCPSTLFAALFCFASIVMLIPIEDWKERMQLAMISSWCFNMLCYRASTIVFVTMNKC